MKHVLLAIATMTAFSGLAAGQPATTTDTLTTTPVVQTAEWAQSWWMPRHREKLAERDRWVAQGKSPSCVFVGDSITHGWEQAGKEVWAERVAPQGGAINLGFSGDRTEHVLWRLGVGDAGEANNEIAGLSPNLFVVMIGTNNTGQRQDDPAETAEGVTAIVDRLLEVSPDSRVLLLAVFPRGATPDDPLRRLNDEVNRLIAPLGERPAVDFVDIGDVFLDDSGNLPKSIMGDLLHPEAEGYRRWADAIAPYLMGW
ncbi:MAG: GDSL-type esterase/lipase family protein [Planctomycetota bacterium]